MPSFDTVSEVDKHEATNAIDQANRELERRWDFKGAGAKFELNDFAVTLLSNEEFQLDQMAEILESALIKRSIKTTCLEYSEPEGAGKQVKKIATIRQGIDKELSKQIVKKIKDSKMKVQASIQGETVRVTGKKRDDLQQAMALLRGADDILMPLQFKNFKDWFDGSRKAFA